jgi:hypothetical protein
MMAKQTILRTKPIAIEKMLKPMNVTEKLWLIQKTNFFVILNASLPDVYQSYQGIFSHA